MADIFAPHRRWRWAVGSESGYLTGSDLEALYRFLCGKGGATKEDIAGFLRVPNLSHRKADRALQLLRKEGLASYQRETQLWFAEVARG